jgi:hypothetical protein
MSSSSTNTARYGSWKSPITSELIVAQSITLSEVCLDGEHVYWLEGRPQEQGRYVVVRAGADGQPTDITPAPYNARTRVHEYGGGSWTVRNGTVYFSNFADGRLYRQAPGVSEPRALTPEPPGRARQWRYADGVIDQGRSRWIGVREDHTVDGEPVNAIVAVDLGGGRGPGHVLASGHDFYASPRLSPDGRWLAWLAWDHPNMPWNGTQLYLGEVAQNGAISGLEPIAGGTTESIFQPQWSPDGTQIVFVSESLRLVESLLARSRNASDAGADADDGGVWVAAMVARHVDLCFRRAGADCLHLFPRGTWLPRGAGSGE